MPGGVSNDPSGESGPKGERQMGVVTFPLCHAREVAGKFMGNFDHMPQYPRLEPVEVLLERATDRDGGIVRCRQCRWRDGYPWICYPRYYRHRFGNRNSSWNGSVRAVECASYFFPMDGVQFSVLSSVISRIPHAEWIVFSWNILVFSVTGPIGVVSPPGLNILESHKGLSFGGPIG